MAAYLNPKLVETSFWRLAPKNNAGKGPMERTSALMFFLAFDTMVKSCGRRPLDFNPETLEGRNNRATMKLEFTKLISLKPASDGKVRHVVVLGKEKVGGLPPEKRISSNFLTVPVKKASESVRAFFYPNRSSSPPLLKMGSVATSVKWGVDYHDDWRSYILMFLAGTKSKTPFTDLAIFVFRGVQLSKGHGNVQTTLADALKNRFSADLAKLWAQCMAAEKVFFELSGALFSDTYQESLTESEFSAVGGVSDRDALRSLNKEALIDKIVCYEDLLTAYDIEF